jgi:hypothetical protein
VEDAEESDGEVAAKQLKRKSGSANSGEEHISSPTQGTPKRKRVAAVTADATDKPLAKAASSEQKKQEAKRKTLGVRETIIKKNKKKEAPASSRRRKGKRDKVAKNLPSM